MFKCPCIHSVKAIALVSLTRKTLIKRKKGNVFMWTSFFDHSGSVVLVLLTRCCYSS